MEIDRIHERATQAAHYFLKSEKDLVSSFQEVEETRNYLKYECSSMYAYATGILGLSENAACTIIAVARKSKSIPELKTAIDAGILSVSTARKIVPVVTLENHSEWIIKAQTLTSRELEEEIVRISPQQAVRERLSP